jgi:hypothetical protein
MPLPVRFCQRSAVPIVAFERTTHLWVTADLCTSPRVTRCAATAEVKRDALIADVTNAGRCGKK